MKIIFVRHGEKEDGSKIKDKANPSLTKKGILQAECLGKKLKEENISEIYTSNLQRAKQTGEIISKITKVKIKGNFEELNEFNNKIFKSRIKWFFNKRFKKLKILMQRISLEKEENKTILIVAHGHTNRILIGYFLDIPLRKQLLYFTQYNTAVNSVKWSKTFQNWKLESMNDLSHLPNKLK